MCACVYSHIVLVVCVLAHCTFNRDKAEEVKMGKKATQCMAVVYTLWRVDVMASDDLRK